MQIQPYIIFNGNCEEALNFYAKAFGGEVGSMMRFSDAPPDVQGMSNDNNLVMHATFQAKGLMFMASDSGQTAPSAQGGGGGMVHLSINFDNAGELDNVFAKLSEGGNVTMPLQDTFWGARFGMLTDRFGVNWMFNHDKGSQ
ncbi:MAG TPA: VOC family protein [Flavisolibacter sp.]